MLFYRVFSAPVIAFLQHVTMSQEPSEQQYPITVWDRVVRSARAAFYWLTEPARLQVARLLYEHKYREADSPLVTIMLPTYKRGELLVTRTLPSLLAQTYTNIEIIIVGDIGVDDTKKYMERVTDPRVRYEEIPHYTKYPKFIKARWHVGGVPPRNHGLRIARGKWIAELDDDDIFTPDHVEALLRFAQNGKYEFVSACYERERYGKRDIVDAKGEHPRIGGLETVLYRSYLTLFKYNIDAWRKDYDRPQEIDRQLRMFAAGVRFGFLEKVVTYVLPLPGAETVGLDALELRTGQKLR